MNRQCLRFELLSTKRLSTKLLRTMYKSAVTRVKRMSHVSLVTATVVILSVALTALVQAKQSGLVQSKQSGFVQAKQSATKKQDQQSKQNSENRVHVVEHSEEIYELEIMNESEMVKRIVARIKQRQDGADANHVRKAEGIGVIAEAHAPLEPGRFQFAIEAPQEHYWIGVRCEPLTLLTKSQLKLDFGLAVQEVVPQSPAENAGIVVHDILFRVGDQKLETTIDLVNAVDRQKSQVAEFEVIRGGRNITVNIQPQRRPQLETEQIVLGVFEDSKFDSVKVDAQLQKIKGWVKTQTNASGRNLEVLLVRPGVAFDEKKLKSQQYQLVSKMGDFIYMRDPVLGGQSIIQSVEPIKFRGNVNSMVHLRFTPHMQPVAGSQLRSRNEVVVFPNTPQNLPNLVLRSSEPGIWVTAAQAGDQDHLHSVLVTSLDRQANQLMDRIIELESRHRAIAEFIADSENRQIPTEQMNALQQNQTEVQKSIKKFREHHARLMQRIHSFNVPINTGIEIHTPANLRAPENSQFQRRPSIDPPPVEIDNQSPSGSNSGNHPN